MILFLCQQAMADSDTIGGADNSNNNADMLKLVEFEVSESVAITQLSFAVYGRDTNAAVTLVAYHRVGAKFELVGSADGKIAKGDNVDWAESGDVSWLLEGGQSYGIGAFVGDGYSYFYQDDRTDNPGWGQAVGSYQIESGVENTVDLSDREAHYYYMQVDSVSADSDGDGFESVDFGGTDCDDTDAAVGETTEEIPYDGIDQDCSGSDLTDVDADGVNATEAGGADCNDADAGIAPGIEEICGDGIDQDCSGADLECGGGPGGGSGDGAASVDASPECGCNAGSGFPALISLLLAGAGVRSRRR